MEADLADPQTAERVFDAAEGRLGGVTALVMCHCESVDSGLLDTTLESLDRHFAVNARATWLPIREYGRRIHGSPTTGHVISLTSDRTVGNLPYQGTRARRPRWADTFDHAPSARASPTGARSPVEAPSPAQAGGG